MAKEEAFISYWIPDHGMTREDAFECRAHVWDLEDAAEEAADDYHSNHDGWESSWPMVISVEVEGNQGTFSVDREAVPTFHARKCSESDAAAKLK